MFDSRKLIDYLPPVLQKVMEFMAITGAQQPEIEAAWDALDMVMNNQFIDSATENGVAAWEKELNITPLVTDTLNDRKQRIKTAWTYGVVYTYNWLVDWLKNSCGEDTPLPTISGYTLCATLPVSVDYIRILNDMQRHVPANILIDPLILLTKVNVPHYAGSAFRIASQQTITTENLDMDNINALSDEQNLVLTDDQNRVLVD